LDQAGGRANRRDDQKPGNVIANDQFASPTDLEMTSAFGPILLQNDFAHLSAQD
jgi:hypothetical protein